MRLSCGQGRNRPAFAQLFLHVPFHSDLPDLLALRSEDEVTPDAVASAVCRHQAWLDERARRLPLYFADHLLQLLRRLLPLPSLPHENEAAGHPGHLGAARSPSPELEERQPPSLEEDGPPQCQPPPVGGPSTAAPLSLEERIMSLSPSQRENLRRLRPLLG